MAILAALPATVFLYVALAFRSHLFVWTVFSPKLIYTFFHATLIVISLMGVYIVDKIV